jgi:hypothetical protein
MRTLYVLSATRRWHRSYRTLHFLRLFSISSCLKITHCDTYYGRILYINAKFSISHLFFSMESFPLPKSCKKLYTYFPAMRPDVFRSDRSERRLLRHHACRFLIFNRVTCSFWTPVNRNLKVCILWRYRGCICLEILRLCEGFIWVAHGY